MHVVHNASELGRCAFAGCCLPLTTSSVAIEAVKTHFNFFAVGTNIGV